MSISSFGSLTTAIVAGLAELPEQVDVLARSGAVRVERIVSLGHRSSDGYWYDQDEDEFVVLVSGAARLVVEGEQERQLGPGDWAYLPARARHRVEWTDPTTPTIWLAVFWERHSAK